MQERSNDRPQQLRSWAEGLFANSPQALSGRPRSPEDEARCGPKIGDSGALWAHRLFTGKPVEPAPSESMQILKRGVPVHEVILAELKPETVIGRHPKADIQLEAQRLGMFHACLWKIDDEYYIENLDPQNGTLLNRKKLKLKHPVQLRDGATVDLPGFRLLFRLPAWPAVADTENGVEEIAEIPDFFYSPSSPPPPPCPLLSHLINERDRLCVWTKGPTMLRVTDIIEETQDVKTFRFSGIDPLLFSYQPGQFVTFLLRIGGHDVQRSYSMSSSPSRPHTLDLTIKRVPGGSCPTGSATRSDWATCCRSKGPPENSPVSVTHRTSCCSSRPVAASRRSCRCAAGSWTLRQTWT